MNATDPAPHELSDEEVWDDYRRTRSEDAFRRLVERHVPLVWAVARRTVNGERTLAEDVAQIVFADLARLAPRLPARFGVGGWLHRHTFFTASKAVRAEVRRRAREHTAAAMQEPSTAPSPPDALPSELAPHLDAALAALAPRDREVIVLRYLQQRSVRDVSLALDLPEETARKRLSRALEKLRAQLRRRGITTGSALLGGALATQAVGTITVPAGLASQLAAGAWGLHLSAAGVGGLTGWLAGIGTPVAVAAARWGARPMAAAGVAALACLLGGFWWSRSHTGVPSENTVVALRESLPPVTGAGGTSPAAAVSGELRFDLFFLPKSSLAVRLLRFRPGVDDATLYQELGAPEASGGVSFTVPLHRGRKSRFAEAMEYKYATEFKPEEDDLPEPTTYETREVGTVAEVEVTQEDEVLRTTFTVEHHRASPSTVSWPISSQPGDDRAVGLPQFHPLLLVSACQTPPGEPVLAATSLLSAPGGGDFSAPPTYALLFLTFQPAASR